MPHLLLGKLGLLAINLSSVSHLVHRVGQQGASLLHEPTQAAQDSLTLEASHKLIKNVRWCPRVEGAVFRNNQSANLGNRARARTHAHTHTHTHTHTQKHKQTTHSHASAYTCANVCTHNNKNVHALTSTTINIICLTNTCDMKSKSKQQTKKSMARKHDALHCANVTPTLASDLPNGPFASQAQLSLSLKHFNARRRQ